MQRVRLDSIDRKILKALQTNGRMTNVDLAQQVGITAPPCLRRVRALEQAGYIKGYHADLDPKALGFEVMVFVSVALDRKSEAEQKAFETKVASWPMVRDCYLLLGEHDFLLRCIAPDLSSFQRFLTETLTATDNVGQTRTVTVVRTSKSEPGVPFEEGVVPPELHAVE